MPERAPTTPRSESALALANAITTDPKGLMKIPILCDERNLAVLRMVFSSFMGLRIAAWGAWPPALMRRLMPGIVAIKSMGSPLLCFGFTKSGEPRHPSRIPYDSPLLYLADGRAY
jgi:hypothetical protein